MREFSTNEKRIIQSALLNGSGLSGMLSDDFRLRSQLIITYKTNGIKRFNFASDTMGKDAAFMELVDQINLLQYLLEQGLVTAYPMTATVIRGDSLQDELISLGEGDAFMNINWNTSPEDGYIADFVKRHENSHFKATEPLATYVKHNWKTWDQRKHQEGIIVAISIGLLTAIIAAAGIWIQYFNSGKDQQKIERYNTEMQKVKQNQSEFNEGSARAIITLSDRIDSLKAAMPKPPQPKKKNK